MRYFQLQTFANKQQIIEIMDTFSLILTFPN